jgi:hypothetical protein
VAFAVDGTNLYWADGQVEELAKSGGSTVAVDETGVYYPDTVGRGLGKIPK